MPSSSPPLLPRTVGIFVSSLDGGGVTWAMFRLAQGLKRAGLSVSFFAAKNKGALKEAVAREFEIVDLRARSSFLSFPALTKALATRKPDIFISNILQGNLASVLARFLARLLAHAPTRLILIDHALISNELSLCPRPKELVERFLLPFFYARADKIVAVSNAARQDTLRVARLRPSKVEVIHNPVIPYDFDSLCEAEISHPWLKDKTEPVVLGLGRLNPEKGFADLIKAFALVRRSKKARLVIVGEGALRARLSALADELGLGDCVSLVGYQTPVFPWIKKADLLVQPSLSEAFGNTIVEALACGTPVVSTRSGGPCEILEEGRYGRLVPAGQPSALAAAMIEALDEKEDASLLRARGLSFSIDGATKNYLNLFRRLLEEKRETRRE